MSDKKQSRKEKHFRRQVKEIRKTCEGKSQHQRVGMALDFINYGVRKQREEGWSEPAIAEYIVKTEDIICLMFDVTPGDIKQLLKKLWGITQEWGPYFEYTISPEGLITTRPLATILS